MSILILADHDDSKLSPSTRACIIAALQIGGSIDILVTGHHTQTIAESVARVKGVSRVLQADAEILAYPLAEYIAPLIASLAGNYTHILASATSMGKDILPRVAALLDVAQISDVIKIISADTFVHPIYAGNALETVQSTDNIKLLTIRATAFAPAEDGGSASIETVLSPSVESRVSFSGMERSESERPDLASARVVISGGRGIGSAENFHALERIASKLNAALGASRAAVDAGYAPNDLQVGQTGKIVAPDLYIAVGISGAIQHVAGMKDSKIIVAINKDENAPIFEIADYGLVADLHAALPEFEKLLS